MHYIGRVNQEISFAILVTLRRMSAALVAVASFVLCMALYDTPPRDPYRVLLIIVALLAFILFPGRSEEETILKREYWSVSLAVFSRWCLLVAVLLLLGYATKTSSLFSRKLLLTWIMVTPPLLVTAQVLVETLISRILVSHANTRRVAVAGANELGAKLVTKIRTAPRLAMQVDGFFDDRSEDRLAEKPPAPILGPFDDLPRYVRENNIDLIFVVLPILNTERMTELIDQLHDTTASIYFVPDVFVFDLIQCRTADIDGMPVVALCESPFHGAPGLIKRFSDYIIATLVLLLLSPLMLAIAAAIKLTTPGSVIFRQRRYGLDGREIIIYKFRTMTVSEDADEITQASPGDERVTRFGTFLRKYSLDELPQFINVLQGRMSVVGPRPHAVAHNEQYRPLIKGYMVRHKVRPGITGLAQVLGYRGETSTVELMRKRVEYDLEYLRNWSLELDFRILIKTIGHVLGAKAAY